MPQKCAGGSTITTAETWATKLTTAIKTGTYSSVAHSWTTGISITDPVGTTMAWVQEANSYVCSNVLKKGISYLESTDLSSAYYTAAVPVFEEQIARAGYRLAAWLDLIATGSTSL
jgi:S1/P1 Nuclease